MIQDPTQFPIEMLPTSEGAQEWVQLALDVGFVVAAVSSVVLACTGHIQRVWLTIVNAFRAIRHEDNAMRFNQRREASDELLREIQSEFSAMRAMLLSSENGEFVNPVDPQKVSVVTAAQRQGVPSVFRRFQSEPADEGYQHLLYQVMKSDKEPRGCVFLVTSEMREGWLQDYYLETGIVCSVVFYVRMNGWGQMLYVTVNFGEPLKAATGADGVPVTQSHDEDTVRKHLALARELADHPERIRRMKRHMKALWGRY